jgi:hypothetical protein
MIAVSRLSRTARPPPVAHRSLRDDGVLNIRLAAEELFINKSLWE